MDFNTYLCICTVEFWDEVDLCERIENSIINGSNFIEAAQELEAYYGNHIISMKIFPLEDGPVIISRKMANKFINGTTLEGEETKKSKD